MRITFDNSIPTNFRNLVSAESDGDSTATADISKQTFLSGESNGTTAGSNTSFQTAGNTSNTASSTMSIGGIGAILTPSSFWNGHIQEVVCYSSNQNTTRLGIQDNLNDYFDIY